MLNIMVPYHVLSEEKHYGEILKSAMIDVLSEMQSVLFTCN